MAQWSRRDLLKSTAAFLTAGVAGMLPSIGSAAALAAPVSVIAPELPDVHMVYPDGAGIINVKDFGAKGDGKTDDTAAINRALAASGTDTGPNFWQDRIVYFPVGTYMVSDRIQKLYSDGKFASGAIMMGESRDKTIIQLAPHAKGYGDKANPKAIIFTTSKRLDNSSNKDVTKGEGNDAYNNYIENMTIDAGVANAGAIGIDYLTNNQGAIRNVVVKANPSSGLTGISLQRKWFGPGLIKDVRVEGFNTGIETDSTEYGVTMDTVHLKGQRVTGLRNDHNMVTGHNIVIEDAPTPIDNVSPDGLIAIQDGRIFTRLSGGNEAIKNAGDINFRRVAVSGYAKALGQPSGSGKQIDGVYQQNIFKSSSVLPHELAVETPPAIPTETPDKWVSVARFGSGPVADCTQAIRDAFDYAVKNKLNTVYFPHGVYHISDSIVVPDGIEHIVGMGSTIRAYADPDPDVRPDIAKPDEHPPAFWRNPAFKYDKGIFITANTRKPLIMDKLAFDNSWHGNQLAIEVGGTAPLYMRDIVAEGVTTLKRHENGGKVFIENTTAGDIQIAGKQGVWARQLNIEGKKVAITNEGSPLWALGLKTESDCTAVDASKGAKTEIRGALLYIAQPAETDNPPVPALRNTNSQIMFSGVNEAPWGASYSTFMEDTLNGVTRKTASASLPARNQGRMVSHLCSQNNMVKAQGL